MGGEPQGGGPGAEAMTGASAAELSRASRAAIENALSANSRRCSRFMVLEPQFCCSSPHPAHTHCLHHVDHAVDGPDVSRRLSRLCGRDR
jgi:hypothetical protein